MKTQKIAIQPIPLFKTFDELNQSPISGKLWLKFLTINNSIFIQEAKVKERVQLTLYEKNIIISNFMRSNNGLIRSICSTILSDLIEDKSILQEAE
ncbi:MAG: hypothetical protein ABII74_10640 [Elusimicrobiota bacterium]